MIAYVQGIRLRNGTLLRARVDIDTAGLIYTTGPFTTGFRCRIPRGTVLRVFGDQGPASMFFSCTIPDKTIEAQLIPPEDRLSETYAGHAFVFGAGEIGHRLDIVEEHE